MSSVATIAARLLMDGSAFDEGIASAKKQADTLKGKLQKVGGQMTKMGGVMSASVTTPIVAGMTASVMAASDLGESIGAVETVFGDAQDTIFAFGETSAQSVGLSKEQFNSLGIVTGSLLQNLGFDAEGAADKTVMLAERASDMAAVFNTDVDQALGAIQSGLKGEFNPLEQFGVKMNQAAIDAKALEMGLIDTEVSLIDVEKATSTLGKAQDNWNSIVGDAVDSGKLTTEQQAELANALYALDDAYEEAGTNSTEFNSAIENGRETWAKYSETLGEEGRTAFLQYAEGLTKVEGAMAGSTGKIDDNAKAQAALALVMEQTDRIQGTFTKESESLGGQMRIVKAQLKDVSSTIGAYLLPYVTKAANWVGKFIEKFQGLDEKSQKIIIILALVAAAIGPILVVVGTLVTAIGALIPVITAVGGFLSTFAIPIIAIIALIALLALAWKNNWGGIREKTAAVVAKIKEVVSGFLAKIKAWWDEHKEKILGTVQALWDGLLAVFDWFKGQFQGIMDAFKLAQEGDWEAFGEKLREVWDEAWEKMKEIVGKAWDKIKEKVDELVKNVIEFFKTTDWKQVGDDVVAGIAEGITAGAKWAVDAIKNVAGNIWDALTGFFKSNSPSKLTEGLGKGLPQGLAIGIEKMAGVPKKAIEKMASNMDLGTPGFMMEGGFMKNQLQLEGVGGSRNIENNYNLYMQGYGNPEDVLVGFDLMRKYGGE